MKEYLITVDVVMSGDVTIEAKSEAEAKKILYNKNFQPSDLDGFYQMSKKIIDVQAL